MQESEKILDKIVENRKKALQEARVYSKSVRRNSMAFDSNDYQWKLNTAEEDNTSPNNELGFKITDVIATFEGRVMESKKLSDVVLGVDDAWNAIIPILTKIAILIPNDHIVILPKAVNTGLMIAIQEHLPYNLECFRFVLYDLIDAYNGAY